MVSYGRTFLDPFVPLKSCHHHLPERLLISEKPRRILRVEAFIKPDPKTTNLLFGG